MVSLNTQHGRHGGGMSFDDRSINADDHLTNAHDELMHDNTPLIVTTEQPYRRIGTTMFIIIHILYIIAFETIIVLFPFLCYDENISSICGNHSPYNISLYIHAASYLINVVFDRIYHYHQDLSRRDGYLDFYRQTRNLRRTPLIIISTSNAILVIVIKLLEDYPDKLWKFQPWHFLAILTTIEVIICLIALIWYLIITIQFNRKHIRPDAAQDDYLSTFATSHTTANEIGFRDEIYTDNVLEKQADLIRYLRERNEHLSRLVQQFQRV